MHTDQPKEWFVAGYLQYRSSWIFCRGDGETFARSLVVTNGIIGPWVLKTIFLMEKSNFHSFSISLNNSKSFWRFPTFPSHGRTGSLACGCHPARPLHPGNCCRWKKGRLNGRGAPEAETLLWEASFCDLEWSTSCWSKKWAIKLTITRCNGISL